ncbi:GbsR/MarR family transcriptional regulator [Nocardia pseudobrasiliensis]|uniref:MarR family protein n=1 Tax=Nocardia pseudobrasiliensis TaxID=45979 RepID=A0A370I649_9NOCA|nr:helix-turn-helix domain-containing protein [Nocardia pseudobrasiliensis]RDI65591.1 MarR family protein [Nocardia pseudobrasiliensis]
MPGGRLTLHERECIAAGLADGLGYTEIARQLDRPASTVSREVTRNGGPGRYRADRAHRATVARARRGKASAAPRSAPAGFVVDNDALREFADHFTELLTAEGLPRMQARVLTCLHLTDSGSLTAAELARRLEVSPASVSTAVRALERRDLLRRERDSPRRDRYRIDNDTWYRGTLNLARTAEARFRAARRGAELLGPATPAGQRLDEMGRLFDYLGREMVLAVERWRST